MANAERRSLIREELASFIKTLPYLSKDQVPEDESCPICFLSFDSILKGNASTESPNSIEAELREEHEGLTKLPGCGHIFCRMDIAEWIDTYHGSCPTCRHIFLDIPQEEDLESSDGGEYLPSEDAEDEDDDMSYEDDPQDFFDRDASDSGSVSILSLESDEGEDDEWPHDDAENFYDIDAEDELSGGLTDGNDTMSSEGEVLPPEVEKDEEDEVYAADVSMTSADEEDEVYWSTDCEPKSDAHEHHEADELEDELLETL